MEFNGIILCGGRSKRMGTDKALLQLGGVSFLERVIALMTPICDRVLISGNSSDYKSFGLEIIEDEFEDSGALSGLFSGLKASDKDWNLILSCDTPLVDLEVVNHLKDHVKTGQSVVHARTNQDNHPLIGFYNKACVSKLESAIKIGNLKLQPAVNKCDPLKVLMEADLAEKLVNINTPDDYRTLLNRYG